MSDRFDGALTNIRPRAPSDALLRSTLVSYRDRREQLRDDMCFAEMVLFDICGVDPFG
jgi:hypothetical protein